MNNYILLSGECDPFTLSHNERRFYITGVNKMARPLNEQVIKGRIKTNMAIMKATKTKVSKDMQGATKNGLTSPTETRKALSDFIKASEAVKLDIFKLQLIKGK